MPSGPALDTPKSGLVMSYATTEDLPQLSTLFARPFLPSSPFYQKMSPDTPGIRGWWTAAHRTAVDDKEGTTFLKCTDGGA
jgi:hypothetical protein